jgi:hypothetical protein
MPDQYLRKKTSNMREIPMDRLLAFFNQSSSKVLFGQNTLAYFDLIRILVFGNMTQEISLWVGSLPYFYISIKVKSV